MNVKSTHPARQATPVYSNLCDSGSKLKAMKDCWMVSMNPGPAGPGGADGGGGAPSGGAAGMGMGVAAGGTVWTGASPGLATCMMLPHFGQRTIMPAYYRLDGFERVAPAFRGRTVLTAEQIEDVVAFLMTLRD